MQRILIAVLLLCVVATAPAWGELKIGFVNIEVILQGYAGTEALAETLNRDVQGWREEAQRRAQELEQLDQALESQRLMLSDERFQEKEMEAQRKANEYQQFVQSVFGPDGLVEQRNEELLRVVISKLQTRLAKLAVDEGYDFIFDASDNNILYSDPGYDLTQTALDLLNSEEAGVE